MKRIRASAHVEADAAPAFFDLLANNPAVEEARVLEINTTLSGTETFLFAIDGDASTFAESAADTPGVRSVEVTEVADGQAYALLVMEPLETPLFEAIHRAGPLTGMVLRTPMIYRDGTMYGEAVGDPEALQRGLDDAPEAIDVRIETISEFRGGLDDPKTSLSKRQREAVDTALSMGYYDQPRGATHEEIAAELDCAPATVSDHLQKAEAKLVRAAMDEFGPSV